MFTHFVFLLTSGLTVPVKSFFSSLGSMSGLKVFLFLQSPEADSKKGHEQKPVSSCFSPSLLPEEENEGFEPTVKR